MASKYLEEKVNARKTKMPQILNIYKILTFPILNFRLWNIIAELCHSSTLSILSSWPYGQKPCVLYLRFKPSMREMILNLEMSLLAYFSLKLAWSYLVIKLLCVSNRQAYIMFTLPKKIK